jgi:hypothetical protein
MISNFGTTASAHFVNFVKDNKVLGKTRKEYTVKSETKLTLLYFVLMFFTAYAAAELVARLTGGS